MTLPIDRADCYISSFPHTTSQTLNKEEKKSYNFSCFVNTAVHVYFKENRSSHLMKMIFEMIKPAGRPSNLSAIYYISGNTGPNTVAFTAKVRNGEHLVDIPQGGKLIFQHVVTNAGNGYDNSTGVFTAPTSGLYHFSFFVLAYSGSPANIALQYNGGTIVQGYAEPVYDSHEETAGNVCVIFLSVGDEVWLETAFTEHASLFGGFSAFTGVMITRV